MSVRTILIYVVVSLFLFSTISFAIEKRSGKKLDHKKVDSLIKRDDNQKPQKKNPLRDSRVNRSDQRDYNDFIDRNNNGIDDRVERKKKASSAKKIKKQEQQLQQQKKKSISPQPRTKSKKR